MKTIALLAIEGCLSSSITNLIDSFTIANLWHASFSENGETLFETQIVSPAGNPVICSNNIQINPHYSFKDQINADYLIIPALLPIPKSRDMRNSDVLDFICRNYSSGTTIASVCTGAFLLAETGLLNGKCATTNWRFERKFRYRYPKVHLKIDEILTENDNIICSGAVTAIMHLALRIIQREGSSQLASVCAKTMLVDSNNASQAPYVIYPLNEKHYDAEIQKAQHYMRDHLAAHITIDEVAEFVCISPRHFKRRFKNATGDSPLNYLQKLRIQTAKNQLENTRDSIEEITHRIGYEDSSAFRRLFKRHTRLSPREYRDKFLMLEKK